MSQFEDVLYLSETKQIFEYLNQFKRKSEPRNDLYVLFKILIVLYLKDKSQMLVTFYCLYRLYI